MLSISNRHPPLKLGAYDMNSMVKTRDAATNPTTGDNWPSPPEPGDALPLRSSEASHDLMIDCDDTVPLSADETRCPERVAIQEQLVITSASVGVACDALARALAEVRALLDQIAALEADLPEALDAKDAVAAANACADEQRRRAEALEA
jgi:hypothetical protein